MLVPMTLVTSDASVVWSAISVGRPWRLEDLEDDEDKGGAPPACETPTLDT